jgi:hypothetical protein
MRAIQSQDNFLMTVVVVAVAVTVTVAVAVAVTVTVVVAAAVAVSSLRTELHCVVFFSYACSCLLASLYNIFGVLVLFLSLANRMLRR